MSLFCNLSANKCRELVPKKALNLPKPISMYNQCYFLQFPIYTFHKSKVFQFVIFLFTLSVLLFYQATSSLGLMANMTTCNFITSLVLPSKVLGLVHRQFCT